MLFYTGANKASAIQQDSSKSLGGWISSSQIPNDVLNNLFGSIDFSTIKDNIKSYRVISFQNLTGAIIPEFKIWTVTENDSFAKFKIGIILNSIDPSSEKPYFEQLVNENSMPMYVSMIDCETEINALVLANVPIGQHVGIFIQRELIAINNPDFGGANKTCEEFYAEFVTPPTSSSKDEDMVEIILSF